MPLQQCDFPLIPAHGKNQQS